MNCSAAMLKCWSGSSSPSPFGLTEPTNFGRPAFFSEWRSPANSTQSSCLEFACGGPNIKSSPSPWSVSSSSRSLPISGSAPPSKSPPSRPSVAPGFFYARWPSRIWRPILITRSSVSTKQWLIRSGQTWALRSSTISRSRVAFPSSCTYCEFGNFQRSIDWFTIPSSASSTFS